MTVLTESYVAAVGAMTDGPKDLAKRAAFEGADRDATVDVGVDALVRHLGIASLNDALRKQLHVAVAKWDITDPVADWTVGTAPRSHERRALVYDLLDLHGATRVLFDEIFPLETEHQVVISDEFDPWYTPDRRGQHELYWPAYSKYLLTTSDWPVEAVNGLDDATTKVIERLSDPLRPVAYQAKGLVVGYVQSGKTANYTGVLAKAIDAGYRLLIVLTGTVDLLRGQTQRRLDMELVGKENIIRGVDMSDPELMAQVDYQDDPAWDNKFLELGFLPSSLNYPDIIRLTTHRFDYKSLKAGIIALEFEKVDKTKPLCVIDNLPSSSARIVVVKKNKSVLKKLVKDLKSIKTPRGEIPAIIIDDESDQASVNTSDPKRWNADLPAREERTAINSLISELLGLLPRAQYVGYTATPFANGFIDPSDVQDIFPKDFLISLDRPADYMGVRDFHDIDTEVDHADQTVANSQEKAHVRDLWGGTARDEELREALDAFVLSGAIKLFRQAAGELAFRHHTMLVHESVRVAEHAVLADDIRAIWRTAGYSSPSGLARLRAMYETDFLPVCEARAGEYSFPTDLDELRPHIATAIAKITSLRDPVIIVNGNKDMAKEDVDFDRRDVWRVLVGGTKLSRGFTIEGLTVSYYRRKTKQADTLMQMGRWFGFRRGYQDLIRLYIGRAEPDGTGIVDLYEAFDGIVRDEEAFRDQLRQYATLVDGLPQITPSQIPPLVSQHLPWLKPAAANKMFNAELVLKKSPGQLVIPTGYPVEEATKVANFEAVLPLLACADRRVELVVPTMENVQRSSFVAWIGAVNGIAGVEAIERITWITDDYYKPDIAFLREIANEIDQWIVIAPQTDSQKNARQLAGFGSRSVFKRDLKPPHRKLWGEPTDRKHRPAALRIAGGWESYGDDVVESLRGERTGAMLLYPMCPQPDDLPSLPEPKDIVLAVAWASPIALRGNSAQMIQFRAKNKAQANAAIVNT